MKKKVSGILAVISFIGSIVTIYTDKTVQSIAEVITLIAICILVIIIINMMWNYLIKRGRRLKEFLDVLVTLKEQSNSLARIDEIVENMVTLNERMIELENVLSDMSQKNMDFYLTYNQTWKKK